MQRARPAVAETVMDLNDRSRPEIERERERERERQCVLVPNDLRARALCKNIRISGDIFCGECMTRGLHWAYSMGP